VVIPLWLLILFPNSMFQNFIAVKNFRFLRFLRLVRIAKFEHYFQEALAAVNSSVLILCFGIARLMVTLLMFNHFNACLWWAIGTRYPNGWAHKYQQNTTVSYQYLTSLHWALTQFQGTSEILPGTITLERGWAVVTVMLALMILCSVVGGLTNMMMQLQSLREEQVWTQRAVCSYLMFNKISVRLSVRIKKYIDWKQRMARSLGDADRVLDMLPSMLQAEVHTEVRGPVLKTHAFFAALGDAYPKPFRVLCYEALKPMSPAPQELIFAPQFDCVEMYFIVSGVCRYTPMTLQQLKINNQSGFDPEECSLDAEGSDLRGVDLGKGKWLSEAVLWTTWEHCGVLKSLGDSTLLLLTPSAFERVAKSHPPAHASIVLYAREFVAALNRFGRSYTDIIDLQSLAGSESASFLNGG